ncbi:hypothetical protein [Nocardia abscessus]|nr:hypothetical protein [Nocardia abscessus]
MSDTYDPEEFGVIAPALAECDDEETVMADSDGWDPFGGFDDGE